MLLADKTRNIMIFYLQKVTQSFHNFNSIPDSHVLLRETLNLYLKWTKMENYLLYGLVRGPRLEKEQISTDVLGLVDPQQDVPRFLLENTVNMTLLRDSKEELVWNKNFHK
jgi:hypothetical protein